MPAPSPKELKKLIKVCRELGVSEYTGDGFSFKLSETGTFQSKQVHNTKNESTSTTFESDTLTDEERMFWSVGPAPTEDNHQ